MENQIRKRTQHTQENEQEENKIFFIEFTAYYTDLNLKNR